MQHITTHCNSLQHKHTATHCGHRCHVLISDAHLTTLQHTATHCNTLQLQVSRTNQRYTSKAQKPDPLRSLSLSLSLPISLARSLPLPPSISLSLSGFTRKPAMHVRGPESSSIPHVANGHVSCCSWLYFCLAFIVLTLNKEKDCSPIVRKQCDITHPCASYHVPHAPV